MTAFSETLRQLRVAQNMGLRETASKVGISPAYLSRIERGKEPPPKPEVIKELARVLAADPDVLFRLSSSTDPDITQFLKDQPRVLELVRLLQSSDVTDERLEEILQVVQQSVLQSNG